MKLRIIFITCCLSLALGDCDQRAPGSWAEAVKLKLLAIADLIDWGSAHHGTPFNASRIAEIRQSSDKFSCFTETQRTAINKLHDTCNATIAQSALKDADHSSSRMDLGQCFYSALVSYNTTTGRSGEESLKNKILGTTLGTPQKSKAISDMKTCITSHLPAPYGLVSVIAKNTKIITEWEKRWIANMMSDRDPVDMAQMNEAKPMFVSLKAAICFVKSLLMNGCTKTAEFTNRLL